MPRYAVPLLTCVFALVFLGTGVAHAAKLEVDPDAPLWIKLATDALLYAHIGGGAVGLASGVAAIAARKGQALHRLAGKVFFVSMFVTYLIGAGVAPFLEEGQRPNFVAGILALYLLITALITVRQRGPVRTNWRHYVGLATALGITLMGVVFMYMGANSATGTVDGSPPQAFILFIVAGSIAAFGELNVILRQALSYTARISRHLWRMCFSMFIASGSLFLGQPQVFPEGFNQTAWPFLLAFAPLIALIVWQGLLRLRGGELRAA